MLSRPSINNKLPNDVYIEPTNRCNARCRVCVRSFNTVEPAHDMTAAEFRHIIDQFPTAKRVVLHGIGEPLLNHNLIDMIRYTKQVLPDAAVLFNSNAILLTGRWPQALVDSGLDEYRVSIDAATSATYARIRGVQAFEVVQENMRRFVQMAGENGSPRVSLWLVALRDNIHELPDLVDLAAELGIMEVYVQRLVLFHDGLANDEQSLYQRLQESEEETLLEAEARAVQYGIAMRASGLTSPRDSLHGYEETERPWSHCHRPWTTTYITANGNVLPCCISPFSTRDYPALIMGNVFETSFAEIWNGPKYVERRMRLQSDHPAHPCELCGMGWSL